MQFALVPSSPEAAATEVIRALGLRLSERWPQTDGSSLLPLRVRELPWPLPMRQVVSAGPPGGVQQPVVLCVDTETSELSWLDAEEDGPAFVVCGSAKSGRSQCADSRLRPSWPDGAGMVCGLPLSRRSPVANGAFPVRSSHPKISRSTPIRTSSCTLHRRRPKMGWRRRRTHCSACRTRQPCRGLGWPHGVLQ